MTLEAISGAAAVALAVAAAFLLLSLPAHWLLRSRRPSSRFAAAIMPEPAQRFRDALAALHRRQRLIAGGALAFAAAFAAGMLLMPRVRPDILPAWLGIVLAGLAAAAVAAALVFLVRGAVAMHGLRFVRDAGIAVGQGLLKLTGERNRVFHEVPCGNWVLDNLVVGLHGVYAVFVVARRPGRHNRLRLQGDQLLFAPGRHRLPLAPYFERCELLARELGKAVGLALRVRPVIAVPGWEIEHQAGDACLVVNERNLVMLRGWKDSREYLMHEDVERLHQVLADRCLRFGRDPGRAPVSFRPAVEAARA